jgi:hypothetical protein
MDLAENREAQRCGRHADSAGCGCSLRGLGEDVSHALSAVHCSTLALVEGRLPGVKRLSTHFWPLGGNTREIDAAGAWCSLYRHGDNPYRGGDWLHSHSANRRRGCGWWSCGGCGSWSDRSRCRGWSRSRDGTNHSQSIIHEPDAAIAAGLRPLDLPRHSSVACSLCACGNSGGQQSQLRDTARRVLVAARWRHLQRLLIGIAQSSPLATIRCLRRQFGRWYAFEMSEEQFELIGLTLALAGLVALYQLLE